MVNVITLSLSQSDHIKRLPLYYLLKNDVSQYKNVLHNDISGNDHEVEFHEIESFFFRRSKVIFFRKSNLLITAFFMKPKVANNVFLTFDLMNNLLAASTIIRSKVFKLMIVLLTSWSNFTETYYCNFWSHEKHKFLSISWLKLLSISCFDLVKFDLLNPCPCCWYIMKKYCIRELWIRIQHI